MTSLGKGHHCESHRIYVVDVVVSGKHWGIICELSLREDMRMANKD